MTFILKKIKVLLSVNLNLLKFAKLRFIEQQQKQMFFADFRIYNI